MGYSFSWFTLEASPDNKNKIKSTDRGGLFLLCETNNTNSFTQSNADWGGGKHVFIVCCPEHPKDTAHESKTPRSFQGIKKKPNTSIY
jgi:hypothetical protein